MPKEITVFAATKPNSQIDAISKEISKVAAAKPMPKELNKVAAGKPKPKEVKKVTASIIEPFKGDFDTRVTKNPFASYESYER